MKIYFGLLLAFLTGVLLTISWPEQGITPLVFIAFVPLLILQQRLGDAGKRGLFWYAWLAFLVWNVLTTWWIWNSTQWGSIAAFVLNALFMAIVFQLFHVSKKWLFGNRGGMYILIFYWVTFEYLHMNWDLTWSWLNLGNVFATKPSWIQWYEITGSLGGTIWVLAVNIMVFNVIQGFVSRLPAARLWLTGGVTLFIIFIPFIWSMVTYSTYSEQGKPMQVVVVQPNIDPYTEQYYLSPDSLVSKNLALAREMTTSETDVIVFPESALQEDIWEESLAYSANLRRMREFSDQFPDLAIVIGATTYRKVLPDESKTHAARKFRDRDEHYYAYNTAFLIKKGENYQIHHKSKLTPGAEIMPSWGILKPLEGLALDLGGTVGTLKKEDYPMVFSRETAEKGISPVICYESVYGEFVANSVRLGSGLVVVITNDGWWGNSPGHRQHLWFSVLRAIETRRSVARSANTGISAFINQRGDILQKTPYWQPAVISQELYANTKMTYYVKNGDYLGRGSGFISVMVLLIAVTQGFLRKRKSLV